MRRVTEETESVSVARLPAPAMGKGLPLSTPQSGQTRVPARKRLNTKEVR